MFKEKKMKRVKQQIVESILSTDKVLTNKFVLWCLRHTIFKSLYTNSKALEVSCNGIAWLSIWTAFIMLASSATFRSMQLNFFIGLLLDIIGVALIKAFTRRRRPIPDSTSAFTIGPDKFSFPSGHASRSCFIVYFFTYCYPLSILFRLPVISWCLCVCLSRILMQRHYILDVICGTLLGLIEGFVIQMIWINDSNAVNIINFFSNDNLPGDTE